MDSVSLRPFTADDRDWLLDRHAEIYWQEHGFDARFAVAVAGILDDFLAGHDPDRERGWIAEQKGARLGSIFCVDASNAAHPNRAQLRLFLLLPEARGLGLGKRMIRECMGFAGAAGYDGMTLWTHESHRAACALYAGHGWQMTGSKPVRNYGCELVEQTWELRF